MSPTLPQSLSAHGAWLLATLLVICVPAFCRAASPSVGDIAPSREALAVSLHEEFAASGTAMRDALTRQAAGDFVGAAVAERDMRAARARFLDLKHELARRSFDPSHSVTADRNPFAPDALMASTPKSISDSEPFSPTVISRASPGTPTVPWDMYRPRAAAGDESTLRSAGERIVHEESRPRAAWGMYAASSTDRSGQAPGAEPFNARTSLRDAPVQDGGDRERPSKPFFVYRNPHAGSSDSLRFREHR